MHRKAILYPLINNNLKVNKVDECEILGVLWVPRGDRITFDVCSLAEAATDKEERGEPGRNVIQSLELCYLLTFDSSVLATMPA